MLLIILLYLMLILCSFLVIAILFLRFAPQLGGVQTGERLLRIERSEQYRDGHFRNRPETPMGLPRGSRSHVLKEYFFGKEERIPKEPLPSMIPDFGSDENEGEGKNCGHPEENCVRDGKDIAQERNRTSITWLGHSTVLIQINGLVLLTDPVLSKRVSPLPLFGPRSFPGSTPIHAWDLPHLDAIIISHDHYDHLDHRTILELKSRTQRFFVPLGVGAHLERWGVDREKIVESDWWEESTLRGHRDDDKDRGEVGGEEPEAVGKNNGDYNDRYEVVGTEPEENAEEKKEYAEDIRLIAAPARHFSGRKFTEINRTLWVSWVIKTRDMALYFGGDSGYTGEFVEIGKKYGPFQVAMLDSGQYSVYWSDIHLLPEQVVQAVIDLGGAVLLPIHWGKLNLSIHPWYEPIERVLAEAETREIAVATPRIGETLRFGEDLPHERWWGPH